MVHLLIEFLFLSSKVLLESIPSVCLSVPDDDFFLDVGFPPCMWAFSPSSDSCPRSFVILLDSSRHWVLQGRCHCVSDSIHTRAWLVTCSGDNLSGTLISLWLDVVISLVCFGLVSDDVPRRDSDRIHTSTHLISVGFVALSQPDFVLHAFVLQSLNACKQLLCVHVS